MQGISFGDASPLLEEIKSRANSLKPDPVFFYPYLKRILNERYKELAPQYPMEIRIPKDMAHLMKGDFEPAQVITIEKPITLDDGVTPIWFEDSSKEVFLRFGYKNCDARYISDNKLDMEYIHAFMGGSSGHGKSVTINSMLASLFYEYAPWELQVHMSDAKIVEFKKYGVNHHIPHIETIAATEDADFVISVLQKAFDDMNMRGKLFGSVGTSNLKSFRKKMNLALPRVLIVMDEVESTFKLAGKKAQKIADLIDGFARLGRAAGYHILMATQNMSSDIPKSAVGQIRVRMCLGANQATSEAVLGNAGATENVGRIGRLIVNTEALAGGNSFPFNVTYQTPFLTDENFETEMEELERKGREVDYHHNLAFYDEEDMKTINEFGPIIDSVEKRMKDSGEATKTVAPIVLGYPAFVSDDIDGLLKIRLDSHDVENICICSTQTDRVAAHLHNIVRSLTGQYQVLHYSTDNELLDATPNILNNSECRDANAKPLNGIDALVRKRLLILQIENLAAGNVTYDRKEIEKHFQEDGIPTEHWGNELMLKRCAVFYLTMNSAEYADMWAPMKGRFKNFLPYYQECVKTNSIIEPLTKDKFARVCIIVGDVAKIIGWGRDGKSKAITYLKKLLQDCSQTAVVTVLYTRSLEGLNELSSGIRYGIFDMPDTKDWGRLRTEAPASQNNKLAVLYDSMDAQNPQKKFKRTLLREEF